MLLVGITIVFAQDVVQAVAQNQVICCCPQLTVHNPMESADYSLAVILTHLKIVTCLTVNSNIIDTLKTIAEQPQQMSVSDLCVEVHLVCYRLLL